MRAAPLPVTLVVVAQLEGFSFDSLTYLTSHIETLVLANIYVPLTDDEDGVPDDLRDRPFFPSMELPGLKQVKVVGGDLPKEYILECFSAICNYRLPSFSLHLRRDQTLDIVRFVRHPIFRDIHTFDVDIDIDVPTCEYVNYWV